MARDTGFPDADAENDVDAEKAKPSTRRAGSAKVEKPTVESLEDTDFETVDAAFRLYVARMPLDTLYKAG